MRSRCRLHKNKLEDFKIWLEGNGWKNEPTKGYYEVLRMAHPNYTDKLLVYAKLGVKEHYTTYGISNNMFSKWINERRQNK